MPSARKPDRASDQRTRAEWLFQQGNYDKSQIDFEALIRRIPAMRGLAALGDDVLLEWRLGRIDRRLLPLLGSFADDYAAKLELARALLYSGRCDKARDECWSLITDNTTPVEFMSRRWSSMRWRSTLAAEDRGAALV